MPALRQRFESDRVKYETTYGGMNDWHTSARAQGQFSHVPATGNPHSAVPRAVMPSERRSDEFYRRYNQLSAKVAYQYPDPGVPRERQGRIGGSWRHIKEVLGHGGTRVVFVDGLVRLYDQEKKSVGQSAEWPSVQLQSARVKTPMYNSGVVQHEYERRGTDNYDRTDTARSGKGSMYTLKRQNTFT